MTDKLDVTLDNLPQFERLIVDYGLPSDRPCLALMNYAQIVGRYLELIEEWKMKGKPDPKPAEINYRVLFKGQAMLYGVTPEAMVQFWPQVDTVISALNLTPIPNSFEIRQIRMNIDHTINQALTQANQEIFKSIRGLKESKR